MYYITTCRTKGVGANLVCRWFFNYMKEQINKESVYLLKYVGRKEVKIGMSKDLNPMKRVQQYNTYSATGVEVLGIIECLNSRITEKNIHHEFNHKKNNGEWFNLTDEDVEYIIDKYTDCEYKKAYEMFLYRYCNRIIEDKYDSDYELKAKTSENFIEWCIYSINKDVRINKSMFFNKYRIECEHDITSTKLLTWLRLYSESENLDLIEGRTATERYIIFKSMTD